MKKAKRTAKRRTTRKGNLWDSMSRKEKGKGAKNSWNV